MNKTQERKLANETQRSVRKALVDASAWTALVWERLWPLLVPLFIVACLFLVFTWLGGWLVLYGLESPIPTWAARLVFLAAFFSALWPLRRFEFPPSAIVTRRIENASRLENRPLTAQADLMAMGGEDAFSRALWQAHRERMAAELDDLTSGTPAPFANRFDPYGLRLALPLLAFAAFYFSFSPNGGRFADVYQPRAEMGAVAGRIDAWINPPAYTRKSPIYLTLADASEPSRSVVAPQGSEFFLRYIGEGDVSLLVRSEEGDVPVPPGELEEGKLDREFSLALHSDSTVVLMREGNAVSHWTVSLLVDQAPEISFFENPSSALSGSLQLTYSLKDDYGVTGARAIIEPVEEADPDARPLVEAPEIELPLPRFRTKRGVSKLNRDLTKHPWAGSRVKLRLEAHDDLNQTGTTETRELTLPGRRFSKPLSLALLEQRRVLAMDANRRNYVANLLDAVSRAPDEFIDDVAVRIGMRVAYRRLVDARSDDELRSTLDLLWDIALGYEFGDLSEAERRLREAQERLSEALENGASEEEIDRLMQELREAMNQMMQALAEQAQNNPQDQNPFDQQNSQTLSQNDLQRMLDQIENLAKSGSHDAARQMLSEMQRMMDNLRAGRHQQQRQAEGNELNRSLDKLSELMQRQQQLMNETYQMQRQQEQGLRPDSNQQNGQQQRQGNQRQGQNQNQQQGAQSGEQSQQGRQGQMTQEEFEQALEQLRQQQEALQQQLGELGKQLEQLGLGQSQELNDAQREMGEAGENLGQGDAGSAATDQGQALEALRKGAQNMMQQMAGDRQQGGRQQSENGGQGQAGQRRGSDPLGRQTEADGLEADADVRIPGEIDAQRAREILNAIRDRLANPNNPLIERDYLERLLRSE